MNRELVKEIILSSIIVLSQLLIFNHISLFGTVDTFIYVSLFILYKTTYDKTYLIVFGFLVGLIIDLSLQTYGVHTLASITVCYLKERIEKYSFGVNSTLPLAMIKGTQQTNRVRYFFLIIFLHSLIYFSLIFFKFEFALTIFLYTLINSIINFIIIWIISMLIFDK
jgi:hypothetical protein